MQPRLLLASAAVALFTAHVQAGPGLAAPPAGTLAVGDWTQLSPGSPLPTPRREHAAVYDPINDRMIVYGGAVSASANEATTWQLSFTPTPTWTELHPTLSPNAKRGMSAIYDPVRQRVIVFGGDTGSAFTNDVWALSMNDLSTWVQLIPQGTPPPARISGVAAYDPAGDRMLVALGYPSRTDVWALSLSGTPTWTQILPGNSPPSPRFVATGSFDPTQNRLVFFSGTYPTFTADTWTLSLSGTPMWQQLAIAQPPALVAHSAIVDPSIPAMVVYGGLSSSGDIVDAWALSLSGPPSWTLLSHGAQLPLPRRFHSAIYRSAASQMVVFGGFDDPGQTFRNDVWTFQLGTSGPPAISGFSPQAGTAGDVVTISGFNMTAVTDVRFNGTSASFTVINPGAVQATVPPGATTGPIEVVSPYGSDTSDSDFFVGVPPVVSSTSSDSAGYGETVLIHGSHFVGTTQVRFGGTGSAAFTVLNDADISAVVDSAASSGPISVTNPAGTGTSVFTFQIIGINPRPHLLPVRDVPLDQGGRVVVRWTASVFDTPNNHSVTAYRVWRRAPLLNARAPRRAASQSAGNGPPHLENEFWESLSEIPAARLSGYAYAAPTLSDSIAEGNPFTAFAVQALTSNPDAFYFSNVDSGYSVDNLPPGSPSSFVATHAPAGVALHWQRNTEADFVSYRLYRGSDPDFVPDASNLIATQPDTGYVDAGSIGGYYKVGAEDVHGNVSAYSSTSADAPTPALMRFATLEVRADRVRLTAQAPGSPGTTWTLQRRSTDAWHDLRDAVSDASGSVSFDDADVRPGERYDYRLSGAIGGQPYTSPTLTVTIPSVALAVSIKGSNPFAGQRLTIAYVVPRATPARVDLIDVSGRLIVSQDLGSPSAGRHEVTLDSGGRLRSGIHFARVTQDGQSVMARVAIVQ